MRPDHDPYSVDQSNELNRERQMRDMRAFLASPDSDPVLMLYVEDALPDMTLIGPAAGAELRRMVYG